MPSATMLPDGPCEPTPMPRAAMSSKTDPCKAHVHIRRDAKLKDSTCEALALLTKSMLPVPTPGTQLLAPWLMFAMLVTSPLTPSTGPD